MTNQKIDMPVVEELKAELEDKKRRGLPHEHIKKKIKELKNQRR